MKTLEDEWYIVIKAYTLKFFCIVIIYGASTLALHVESTTPLNDDGRDYQ